MIDLRTQQAVSDWQLDADGLEHRRTGYFIARDALGARRPDGLWEWPLHLAEKSWYSPAAFRAAFLAALDRFGIERDALLSHSFAVGVGMRTGSAAGSQAGFVGLGELVRPKLVHDQPVNAKSGEAKPVQAKPAERNRPDASESRSAARGRRAERGRVAVGARA